MLLESMLQTRETKKKGGGGTRNVGVFSITHSSQTRPIPYLHQTSSVLRKLPLELLCVLLK